MHFVRLTISLLSFFAPLALVAVEGGSSRSVWGYTSASAGIQPPPGTFQVRNDYIHRTAHRKTSSGRTHVSQSGDTLRLLYMTHLKFLGADYGYSVNLTASRVSVRRTTVTNVSTVQVQNGQPVVVLVPKKQSRHQVAHGPNDLIVTPIRLGWHWPEQNMHLAFAQTVWLPTAKWSRDRIANQGRPFYTTQSQFGFTWKDNDWGSEVSCNASLNVNFKNHKTHYRSGSEYASEFYLGQRVYKGLSLGLVGYWYQQLTPDSSSAAPADGFRGKTFAYGPCAVYTDKIGGYTCGANLRYYHETFAKNRLKGDTLFFTIFVNF